MASPSSAKFCGDCGAPRVVGAGFCAECGERFGEVSGAGVSGRASEEAAGVGSSTSYISPPKAASGSDQSSRLQRSWVPLVAGLVGVIAVAFAITLSISGGSPKEASSSAGISQALLDYYSASGIEQDIFCSDFELGVGPDNWASSVASRTGLSVQQVEIQTTAWCDA